MVYYTRIYYRSISPTSSNKRIVWYRDHHNFIKVALIVALLLIACDAAYLFFKLRKMVATLHLIQWALMVIFPLIAFLYTFKTIPFLSAKQLRGIGWLKPFFIGFAWSGLVTVYPVFFRQMQSGTLSGSFILPSGLFWFQNFLYISALAVIFDIKDHRSDVRHHLKTYPAILGIRKTITLVIIPVILLSLAVLLLYQWQQGLTRLQIFIQIVPFIVTLIVTGMFKKNRSVLFYLAVVDGMMLLKGACGIISISFF